MLVTATDLPRLLACNGSRLIEGFTSSIEQDDTTRNEGDAAHWVAEQVFKGNYKADELIDRKAKNGVFITSDMVENLTPYLQTIGHDGFIEYPSTIDSTKWQVSSRADHVVMSNDGVLRIDDFKYGWRIVEPENNWTLIAHAVGFINKNQNIYPAPNHIQFTIFQPRPHHPAGKIRSWKITLSELMIKYSEMMNRLDNLNEQLNTSENCYKCPALVNCPAARKAQFNAIEASEKAFTDKIDNTSLTFLLDELDRASEIINQSYKAYGELALHRLKKGEIVSNYAIENDLTNNQWKEHVTAEMVQALTGVDINKKQLMTPPQAKKIGLDENIITVLTERRNKGVKLIRMNDHDKAKKLFNK